MLATKKERNGLWNRIFSIAGLAIGGAILAGLVIYVGRTMDVKALLASVRPVWLLCAALCIPVSEGIDALIFYGMGKSAGCPVKLSGCFDATFIGEFYYKLGPAGAPVQLKLMYDAGMSPTYTASIYIWKMVANLMVYTAYAVAALVYKLGFRRESIGFAVVGAGVLILLYLVLCGLALLMAVRPAPMLKLIRRLLAWLSKRVKALGKEGRVDAAMRKVEEFCDQLKTLRGNGKLLAGLYIGMFLELAALFSIPFFLYRGLGLSGHSFLELLLAQALVMIVSRIVVLPGNVGGAEGCFYLFMGPVFGEHLAVGMVLWRFAAFLEVMVLGGAWSVVRFARRSFRKS